MKTIACGLLLMGIGAGAGCLNLPVLTERADKPPETAALPAGVRPARPRSPVTADQVNETNGHEMAAVLKEEMDRESGLK